MIGDKRVLALVPARAGSKGLPGKNVRLLQGKPLLVWPIEAAVASRYVDRVVISTDSPDYAALAEAAGAEAPFIRPAELANDTAPSIAFIEHAISRLEAEGAMYDYLVLLEPTSPLTDAADIDAALETLVSHAASADSIVGVTALESTHPAFAVRIGDTGLVQPYCASNFGQLPRRQDIEPLFSLDGSLYISTIDGLRRERSFCHTRTLPFVTPRWKSFEIDDLVDFICVEAILANRAQLERSEHA